MRTGKLQIALAGIGVWCLLVLLAVLEFGLPTTVGEWALAFVFGPPVLVLFAAVLEPVGDRFFGWIERRRVGKAGRIALGVLGGFLVLIVPTLALLVLSTRGR